MLLGRTMKSVAEQVYPYYEHIIMDGGSNDRTLSVAQDYAEKNERIIIHS
jgi:glycosyltransferase involved in cell wall biosynthesis